jgi:peptide/nickel transport system permease protein
MAEEKIINATAQEQEKLYYASQWQLVWWRFRKHKLAIVGGIVLAFIYLGGIFCEFLSPYDPRRYDLKYPYAPPQGIHIFKDGKLVRPSVYGYTTTRDPKTLRMIHEKDTTKSYPIRFFVKGDPYKFWNLWEMDLHLIGVEEGMVFLLGTDRMGRDMLSRILYGARISTSVGLIGVFVSFVLGIIIGGVSGYYSGTIDNFVQRAIELIRSIPTIPLWMALSAALPPYWSPLRIYFAITIILSLTGWTGLARVVRSNFLSLREEDFVVAARLSGASERRIILRHMLPSFMSHVIASITLAVPVMILGETALSFLGLGLRPPVISWGVLLQEAQNLSVVALYAWLLFPAVFVIITVLCFNFLGDGLRDAADPYAK